MSLLDISRENVTRVLSLSTQELAGLSFECSCGKKHSVDIKKIIIEKGAINKVPEVAVDFKKGKLFLVADKNTYSVCGKHVDELLKEDGFNLKTFVFNTPHQLSPDASTLGRLLIEIELGTSLIIAVGSGVINDMCRYLAYKLGIPFIIVGTAPSMDGYASVVTPTIVDGIKATLGGIYPYAIIGDIDILKDAPMEMLYAGFGDILGKLNALADWDLARQLHGEEYCEICASFVKNALTKCIDNIDGIRNREDEAIKYLMEALVIAGVSMGMFGNSRPASGAEHHFAHYWDEDAIARGEEHPLHGNSVGVGTVVAAEQYKLIKDRLPVKVNVPEPEEVTALLKRLGAWYNPADLGISRELFKRSILHSKDSRPKFTSSHFAGEIGALDEIADKLADKFYEEIVK
ncbi:MAG TPA: sn-glycerol-1-phosphate dehydrogenase [Clostridiales bacterium]|nr:sn-glycerol-1-phosphate dehydrogenase [Clostridiales bacterium]